MLSFSSPTPFIPTTPKTPKTDSHVPHTSSPLTSEVSPSPSPTRKASGNRRAQYKSTASRVSSSTRKPSHAYTSRPRPSSGSGNLFTSALTDPAEPSRGDLLRERFKQRCIDRAVRAREAKVAGKRRASMMSSDDADMDMDDEDDESEDFMLNDELFRRIVASASRKQQHSYRVSYQHDVGSSLDPDMEDIDELERQSYEDVQIPVDEDEVRPPSEYADEEAEELAAYAEEAEFWEHIDELAEDIFSLSDLEDEEHIDEDIEMS